MLAARAARPTGNIIARRPAAGAATPSTSRLTGPSAQHLACTPGRRDSTIITRPTPPADDHQITGAGARERISWFRQAGPGVQPRYPQRRAMGQIGRLSQLTVQQMNDAAFDCQPTPRCQRRDHGILKEPECGRSPVTDEPNASHTRASGHRRAIRCRSHDTIRPRQLLRA